MTREQIIRVMRSKDFTPAEKQLLECQYPQICHPGSFQAALFETIFRADPANQRLLARVYPDEVDAVQHWTHGGLREKMELVADGSAA